jgi:hypothetical protein
LVNSRLGLLSATPSRSGGEPLHATRGAPSPEVTGPICRVPWRGFSRPPRYALPAHLCRFAVRSPPDSLEDFLGGPGSARSVRRGRLPSPSPLRSNAPADLPTGTPYRLGGPRHGPRAYPPASLRRSNAWRRDGNLNPLSIACAFRPRLRPASPAADQPGCGTLGHPVGGIRTPLALLMPTFALPHAPPRLPPRLRSRRGRSPTTPSRASAASVPDLSPGGLSAPRHGRPVSYYALFQGWLLLSQPPGCLRAATALPT